jgi:hypothetical protein
MKKYKYHVTLYRTYKQTVTVRGAENEFEAIDIALALWDLEAAEVTNCEEQVEREKENV